MSNNTTTICPYPYTNSPACDVSFAEHLGQTYTVYHGIYCAITGIVVLLLADRLWQQRRCGLPLNPLRNDVSAILWLATGIAMCFIVRSIDPLAYRGVLPLVVFGLAQAPTIAIPLNMM